MVKEKVLDTGGKLESVKENSVLLDTIARRRRGGPERFHTRFTQRRRYLQLNSKR